MNTHTHTETYVRIPALYAEHGRIVIVPGTGETGYVGSVHYAGPVDGSGVITFAMTDGRNVTVRATKNVLVGRPS